MYSEGVLFVVFTKEIGHIQAIDLSLSEQSLRKILTPLLFNTYNIQRNKIF